MIPGRSGREGKTVAFVNEYRALLVFGSSVVLAIALCFAFTWWQVGISEHHWCQALQTLTEHKVPKPANPKANPSRQEGYILYTEFLNIRGEFGCG